MRESRTSGISVRGRGSNPPVYSTRSRVSDMEDTVTYRLSELFQRPVEDPSIELVVTCLNVNEGHNKELMEACQTLNGYSKFVSKVRKYREKSITKYDETHSTPVKLLADNSEVMKGILAAAINTAIDECIKEDILKSFFIEYREEVTEVAIIEYSAERHIQYEKEESYNSGYDSGYNSGYNSGYDSGYGTGLNSGITTGVNNTTDLFSWLKECHREDDILRAIDDHELLDKLFKEYSKAKKTS